MIKLTFFWNVGYWLIEIIKVIHVQTVIYMTWHSAESVIFRNECRFILAVV